MRFLKPSVPQAPGTKQKVLGQVTPRCKMCGLSVQVFHRVCTLWHSHRKFLFFGIPHKVFGLTELKNTLISVLLLQSPKCWHSRYGPPVSVWLDHTLFSLRTSHRNHGHIAPQSQGVFVCGSGRMSCIRGFIFSCGFIFSYLRVKKFFGNSNWSVGKCCQGLSPERVS